MKDRIKYLDVAKFIGIFCIFLGHFADSSGYAYKFVFRFHVPLFFFLSGFAENLSKDVSVIEYIKKNVKSILLPCYLFGVISIVLNTITTNTYINLLPNIIQMMKGCIRNQFLAGSLWFLTCLFVVKIVFFVLRKTLRFKLLILSTSIILYYIAQVIMDPKPIVTPHLPYNIDSACYYIVFYALGYCCYKKIYSILEFDNNVKRIIGVCIGGFASVYSILLFFDKNILAFRSNGMIAYLINGILIPFIIIVFVLFVSKFMENVTLFSEIGKNTLYLCGSEYIVKLIVPNSLQIVGLGISLPNPLAAYIYTFMLLIICNKFLAPMEKSVLKKLHLL